MRCRDDQAKVLQPRKALDDRWTGQMGALHEEVEADRHAPIGKAARRLDDRQIDLNRVSSNATGSHDRTGQSSPSRFV